VRYWVAVALLVASAVAYAQSQLPTREVGITWSRGTPQVSFSAKDLADERVREELSSGLRKRLVVIVASHLKGSNRRLAVREFGCDVTRDLWDDGYVVRLGSQSERLGSLEQVLSRCLVVEGLFVGDPDRYQPYKGEEIYFAVKAEFNPISKKQCSELIRPASGNDPVGPVTVNIVRRRICRAERTIEFRSDDSQVPK